MNDQFSRRTFGKIAAGSALLWNVPGRVLAQTTSADPFILYIHCGSWDGMSGGLIQPRDVGLWPRGIFRKNSDEQSVNPNLNAHVKTGNLVLTDYHLPLAEIAQHVCVAAGNPQSLTHDLARNIQTTGAPSGTIQPAWTVGLAHALKSTNSQNIVITDGSHGAIKGNATSPEITQSRNMDDFKESVSDPSHIPGINDENASAEKFWEALKARHDARLKNNPDIAQAVGFHLATMTRGFSAFQDTNMISTIEAQIGQATYESYLNKVADGAAVKSINSDISRTNFLAQLRLAAFLAKSGLARGMTITTNNGDRHSGGSSVDTARSGSMMMAQVTAFWKYIIAQKLQDRVMIIISHEFSRTPYNNTPGPTATVKTRAPDSQNLVDVSVRSPGLDHHLAFGMIFINGKVPPASRVGGIGDHYLPFGSKDLRGIADLEIPAYKSTNLVGSMMMRCFDDVFESERAVRQIWPSFTPIDLLVA